MDLFLKTASIDNGRNICALPVKLAEILMQRFIQCIERFIRGSLDLLQQSWATVEAENALSILKDVCPHNCWKNLVFRFPNCIPVWPEATMRIFCCLFLFPIWKKLWWPFLHSPAQCPTGSISAVSCEIIWDVLRQKLDECTDAHWFWSQTWQTALDTTLCFLAFQQPLLCNVTVRSLRPSYWSQTISCWFELHGRYNTRNPFGRPTPYDVFSPHQEVHTYASWRCSPDPWIHGWQDTALWCLHWRSSGDSSPKWGIYLVTRYHRQSTPWCFFFCWFQANARNTRLTGSRKISLSPMEGASFHFREPLDNAFPRSMGCSDDG